MQVQILLRWGAFLAAATVPGPVMAQEDLSVDLELVLAVDISGSIDETEAMHGG